MKIKHLSLAALCAFFAACGDSNSTSTDQHEHFEAEGWNLYWPDWKLAYSVYQGKEGTLPATTPVSMNLWGLTTDIFDILEEEYAKFLKTADLMKDEFYIPLVIGDAVKNGKATVKAYINKDVWHGITYREDLPEVKEAIAGYVKAGLYEGL